MTQEELVEKLSPLNEQLVKVKAELQTIFDKKREFKDSFVQEHSKYKVGEVLNENYKIHDIMFEESENEILYFLELSNGEWFGGFNEEELKEYIQNEKY